MKLLIDTDILLDIALGRDPHAGPASAILEWAARHPGRCAVAWHSIANFHDLVKGDSRGFLRELLEFVVIPQTGTHEMLRALDLGFSDLEDAMQVSAALLHEAQIIVTRNGKHYRKSPIRALGPEQALDLLA